MWPPPAPGGGEVPVDTYLADPGEGVLGIKKRGQRSGLEIKALVSEQAPQAIGFLAAPVQIWTKVSTSALSLVGVASVATSKRRWIRKYDTGAALREIVPRRSATYGWSVGGAIPRKSDSIDEFVEGQRSNKRLKPPSAPSSASLRRAPAVHTSEEVNRIPLRARSRWAAQAQDVRRRTRVTM